MVASLLPITRATVLVCNCDDEHMVVPNSVDQGEREAWDDPPPMRLAEGSTQVGTFDDSTNTDLNNPREARAQAFQAGLVE